MPIYRDKDGNIIERFTKPTSLRSSNEITQRISGESHSVEDLRIGRTSIHISQNTRLASHNQTTLWTSKPTVKDFDGSTRLFAYRLDDKTRFIMNPQSSVIDPPTRVIGAPNPSSNNGLEGKTQFILNPKASVIDSQTRVIGTLSPSPKKRTRLSKGSRVDKYVIDDYISSGGTSLVYRAHHEILKNKLVIKEHYVSDLQFRDGTAIESMNSQSAKQQLQWMQFLFSEEARVLSGIRHDNIVRVMDFIKANNTLYIVLEHIEGQGLNTWLENRDQPLLEIDILNMVKSLSKTIKYLHDMRVIHRDIKPSNIIIRTDDDKPLLIDFGLALSLQESDSSEFKWVTTGYSAPEQYEGEELGVHTDIYSFGATMFTLLTRKVPVDSLVRLHEKISLPSVSKLIEFEGRFSPRLFEAVDKCLALQPQNRPKSINEVMGIIFPKPVIVQNGYKPIALGKKVFVSYRRVDEPHFTGRLLDFLELKFGSESIIADITSIPPGVDFWDFVKQQMSQCAAMLVLIGPKWLDLFNSRDKSLPDYVELEIRLAHELNLPVIPVTFDGAIMPSKTELPESIAYLTSLNLVSIGDSTQFRDGANIVCNSIFERYPF